MGLLSKFGLKNKNTNHYQRNYEQERGQTHDVNDEDSIRIDMGSRGQVTVSKEDRTSYYRKVREQMSERDIETIRDISLTSRTINDVFRRMEHTDLPLEYLVALGRVEEADVEAYQNLKVKGLDLQNTMEVSELEGVDETLKMQVFSQAKEMPKLKQTSILPEEEPTPIDPNIFKTNLEESEETTQEEVEEDHEEVEFDFEVENEEPDESEEDEEEIDLHIEEEEESSNDEDQEENPEEDQTTQKLRNLAESLKLKQKSKEEEEVEEVPEITEEEEEIKPQPMRRRPVRLEDRTIYVVADGVLLPVIKGYNIIKVESMKEINQFTSSKRNLLVISQNIPMELQKKFLSWLQGVSENKTRYRIVTLKGLEVTHDLIEATVSLDGASINQYYEDFPDIEYGGRDVGSFRDISEFLE